MAQLNDSGSDAETTPDERSPRAKEILVAAEALLAEVGYEGLSAQAVADKAQVNKALIFYYWGSTQALFDRVLERFYVRHKGDLASVFEGGGTLHERLHGAIDVLFDTIGKDTIYPRVIQQQVSSRGPHYHLVEHHLQELQAWLGQSLGPLLPETGATSFKQFHLTISAMVINFFTYGDAFGLGWEGASEERRAHVHWVVDAMLGGLKTEGYTFT